MNKLDELIQTLCPDGVEYKTIGEITNISRGKVMSKDYLRENKGEYPVYSSQTENNGMLGAITTYAYDGEYLTWTTDGANAGTVFYRTGKFSITNVCGLIDNTSSNVNTKYLYYVLNKRAPNYVSSGMGNPKLMSNVMSKITIPIPPLEVQQEIVRLLDDFTAKTTELQAELNKEYEVRMKQYYYYRNELLDGDFEIPKMKLKDVVVIQRGKRVVKTELTGDGNYPVYQNALAPMGYYHSKNRDKDNTYLISAGAAGSIGYSTNDFWAADDCFTFKCAEILDNKFLYYSLLNKQSAMNLKIRNASIPRLSRDSLENLVISIPSLNNQKKIVEILEKFDYACSTLQSNISIEIESRQKQYEYYRDKLLTFKELK